MRLYHVALSELETLIRKEGLDPSHRAIILLQQRPEVPEGFDVWEVEADISAVSPDPILCETRIAPKRLEMLSSYMPMPGM